MEAGITAGVIFIIIICSAIKTAVHWKQKQNERIRKQERRGRRNEIRTN